MKRLLGLKTKKCLLGQVYTWATVSRAKVLLGLMSPWATVTWANVTWANVTWTEVYLGWRQIGLKSTWATVY